MAPSQSDNALTEMGLKHKAIHAMLANPHLAPFELIDRPCQQQDWTLIDHLMIIYKVKESDYIEGDSQASIVSMARTLASVYISENAGSRCVVLVKDGPGAQKPAVREIRLNRAPVPHIEFCKRNLCAIEYTMMKLLADMGMKNKLFLVTGAKGDSSKDKILEGTSVDNLVSFHQKYLDYLEWQDDIVFVNALEDLKSPECELSDADPSYDDGTIDRCEGLEDDIVFMNALEDLKPPEFELSDVDPSYADGTIDRPEGLEGVFVATFADPETIQVSILRNACLRCTSTEADTLIVELANVLNGSVTVCTGDSDLVAVLTACGREGITMRIDNRSYHKVRDMHMSSFGEMLFAIPDNRPPEPPCRELASSDDRFRVLCDIAAEDEYLLPTTRKQHDAFEVILDAHGKVNFKENVARYLYLGGIRGSLYSTFLSRFFESNARNRLDGLGLTVDGGVSSKTVSYIFETLCHASDDSPLSGSESDNPPFTGEKRKRSCPCRHEVPELYLDDGSEYKAVLSKERNMNGLKRLSNAYKYRMVPRGSYGRFLRLNQAGWHFFVRMKGDVIRDEKERTERLFFMALCGTDYNIVPLGLGIKRLMTGVVTNYKSFSSWCQELKRLLWGVGGASSQDCDYYNMGMKLADFTNVPAKIRSKHWTEVNCGLMAKTMKYVCELWNLKRPTPGPEYGFSVRDGVVRFDCDSPPIDAANEI